MSQTPPNDGAPSTACRAPRRRRWFAVLALALAAMLGFAAGKAHSSMWFHHWAFHHLDADEITYFVQHRLGKALSNADATPEQRDKIDAIVRATVKDVVAMRKDPAQRREKILAILKADTVDRAALEEVRAEQLAVGEAASKRIVQGIADIADVLTPEQRRKLAANWERWHPLP
jgi:periplasmic protein CpxP/Spy